MKKKMFLRAVLGFPLGISLGYIITIVISLVFANGYYSPAVPALIEIMGNEIYAVILQAALCGVLGAGFAAISVIWEIEDWSISKQTGVYFFITSAFMMPIAYFTHWMEHSIFGVLSYFGIFALIFIILWAVQYLIWKNKINKINENL